MNIALAVVYFLFALMLVLAGVTRAGAWLIERRNPPVGAFAIVDGTRIHFVHVPAPAAPDLPPIVFIHGASANLNDQMVPARPLLKAAPSCCSSTGPAMAGPNAAPAGTRRRSGRQARSPR